MNRRGADRAPASEPPGERCALCADAGEVAEVLALDADGLGRARVRLPDGREELTALDLVDARPGERVLVHLGFALGKVGDR